MRIQHIYHILSITSYTDATYSITSYADTTYSSTTHAYITYRLHHMRLHLIDYIICGSNLFEYIIYRCNICGHIWPITSSHVNIYYRSHLIDYILCGYILSSTHHRIRHIQTHHMRIYH